MIAEGCPVGSVSAGWWVTKRNRGGSEEKDESGFINELKESLLHISRQSSHGVRDVVKSWDPANRLQ